MSVPVINFPPFRPYSNITPFTVRDGATYLTVLEELRNWLNTTLVPHVDTEIANLVIAWEDNASTLLANVIAALNDQSDTVTAQLNEQNASILQQLNAQNAAITAQLAAQDANVAAQIDAMTTYVDNAVQSIINSTIEVSDPVVLGVLESNGASTSFIDNRFNSPDNTTFFVDAVNGNDSNSGKSWGVAYKTIQAAVNAQPVGGCKIVLSAGDHDVSQGVIIPRDRIPEMSGINSLVDRQHADGTTPQTRITTNDAVKPNAYFIIPPGTGDDNRYGGTFKHLYIDADSLADNGAAFEFHGINRVIFEDISGRAVGDKIGKTYVLKADAVGGDDASWLTFRNVVTNGIKAASLNNSNYLSMDSSNSFIGNTSAVKPSGPALEIEVGSQPNITAHFEGWEVAVYAKNVRGGYFTPTGEWVEKMVILDTSADCITIINSRAGAGNSEVVDNFGTRNSVFGTDRVFIGPNTSENVRFSNYGISPVQVAANFIAPIYGSNPGLPPVSSQLIPSGVDTLDGFVGTGIEATYFDGSAFTTWYGPNSDEINRIHLSDTSELQIDYLHRRIKFRNSEPFFGFSGGVVIGRLSAGSAGINTTITVRQLDNEFNVLDEQILPYRTPGNFAGFKATTAIDADYIEVEMNFDIADGDIVYLKSLQFFTPDGPGTTRGKFMRGRLSPEGRIAGRAGDIYLCVGTHSDDPIAGLYKKEIGYGTNTGWVRDGEVDSAGSVRPAAHRVGLRFFDTVLGKPIWVKDTTGPIWVDANGTTV